MPWKVKTPDTVVADIREMRYLDGLPAKFIARMLGISPGTVLLYAPGRPGKVPVAPLREAFLASPVTVADVARHLEWWDRDDRPDVSRVRRTLGINLDSTTRNGRRYRTRRRLADAETVMLIAEAIGVSPWSVLPDEDTP